MIKSLKIFFRGLSMSGKNNNETEKSSSDKEKKTNAKTQKNPQKNDKQNKTNSKSKSPSNQQKNNQKSKNKKKKKSGTTETDVKKQNKKIDDNSKTKNEKSNKHSKQTAVKLVSKKSDPKLKVVKQNLKKTDRKTLSPTKEFELSVEKIKKLENSGYKKLESLGEGSYGKVFKAKSAKHRKQVAIKAVDLKRLSELFKQKYLIVEIELMKKLKEHQNVIKFYEVIEAIDDHLLYITMEYCPNGDLFEYIIRRHFIPEREACLWFKQLISGVQHIHKSGYAHRDIKCENLLLDSKYNIKIVDFGFCCKIRYQKNVQKEDKILSNEEIPSQTYCGSIIYSSPEILRGQPYLPTMTDIWSSGVVLYVMLFGCYPNDGTDLERFIQMDEHCIEAPESPEVSNECKELVKNILIDEKIRYPIKDIKASKWFKKEWPPIDKNVKTKEYFENLNIQRVETLEFDYNPELSEKLLKEALQSDDGNSDLKSDSHMKTPE